MVMQTLHLQIKITTISKSSDREREKGISKRVKRTLRGYGTKSDFKGVLRCRVKFSDVERQTVLTQTRQLHINATRMETTNRTLIGRDSFMPNKL